MEYDPEADIRILEAMASNLTPYLYEDELYGTLGGKMPKLTVGGLLLRLHRLQALQNSLDDELNQRLHDANLNFVQLRSEWMVHFEQKVVEEANARLNNIRAYVSDHAEDAQLAAQDYGVVAEQRTMVHHLKAEAQEFNFWTEDLDDEVVAADKGIKGTIEQDPDTFIWADELREVYPRAEYWWLYATPIEK